MAWRNTAYFFGCNRQSGHCLFGPGMNALYDPEQRVFFDRMKNLDGALAPLTNGSQRECVAAPWRLTGFTPGPYSALSWWDRSVDTRPDSNIIIFAPGHTVSAEDILIIARRMFEIPSVKRDITILPDWQEKTRPASRQKDQPHD